MMRYDMQTLIFYTFQDKEEYIKVQPLYFSKQFRCNKLKLNPDIFILLDNEKQVRCEASTLYSSKKWEILTE